MRDENKYISDNKNMGVRIESLSIQRISRDVVRFEVRIHDLHICQTPIPQIHGNLCIKDLQGRSTKDTSRCWDNPLSLIFIFVVEEPENHR